MRIKKYRPDKDNKKDGCEWRVIGITHYTKDTNTLAQWLPDLEKVREMYMDSVKYGF